MKKISLLPLALAFCLSSHTAKAQVNDPNQVTKDAATDHANNDMNNEADKGLNKAEQGVNNLFKKKNKTKKQDSAQTAQPGAQPATGAAPVAAAAQTPSLNVYSNYDFVPGEKILFTDDFADDPNGEFPTHWQLCYGQGVVTSFDNKKAFALAEGEHGDNAVVMQPRMKKKSGYMPAAFTVELDFYVPRAAGADDDIRSHWVGLNFYGDDEPFNSYDDLDLTPEQLGFYSTLLSEGSKQLPENTSGDHFVNRWHHLAIAYRNKQMKVYLDQDRLYVIPEVKDSSINKFGLRVSGKCVVTNIKVAEGGAMNMLGKKFTDAKIVTHGINFDVDKASIKPESMGTLNMIVQVLKDNPSLKFEIDGHTDNSGSAPHNLTLSLQRADAVKTQLVTMGVDASRLTTKGFGDTKPVSDNTTLEGKASNRRVEFVRTSS
jgi:OmpA-OmpF porin, OOP family